MEYLSCYRPTYALLLILPTLRGMEARVKLVCFGVGTQTCMRQSKIDSDLVEMQLVLVIMQALLHWPVNLPNYLTWSIGVQHSGVTVVNGGYANRLTKPALGNSRVLGAYVAGTLNSIRLFVCLLLNGTSSLFRPLVPRIFEVEHMRHVKNDL